MNMHVPFASVTKSIKPFPLPVNHQPRPKVAHPLIRYPLRWPTPATRQTLLGLDRGRATDREEVTDRAEEICELLPIRGSFSSAFIRKISVQIKMATKG
jgi:hypothetical protein